LHIYSGASGATPFSTASTIIESNSTGLLQVLTSNTGVGGIMFGDPEHSYSGYIRYSHSDNSMKFYTAGLTRLTIKGDGKIGIGITDPGSYKLNVWGDIRAHEVVVNTDGADFVFEPDYDLPALTEVESYIQENKHLPGLQPASEMQKKGMSMSEMQTKLLQKIEELTLYTIEQNKRIEFLEQEIKKLNN
jgi:hypothetical protein